MRSSPPGRGRDQIEPEIVACGLQLVEPRGLTRLVAALRHRDIDNAHARFAHEPQREPADDALVVRDAARR